MAYKLTLSLADRRAIDFVGYRYSNGDELFRVLMQSDAFPDNVEWDQPGDIDFIIPEALAWQISANAEDEPGRWPLFSPSLVEKMENFCCQIV